jgi:hypothetical protein
MLQGHQVEELICLVSAMDRRTIARRLREFRGSFPIDFTPQFVEATDLERLRHIYLALCLQSRRMPEIDGDGAELALEHVA